MFDWFGCARDSSESQLQAQALTQLPLLACSGYRRWCSWDGKAQHLTEVAEKVSMTQEPRSAWEQPEGSTSTEWKREGSCI